MTNRYADRRLLRHLGDFPYIWLFFLILGGAAVLSSLGHWGAAKAAGLAAALLLVALLLTKPMNAVYGLMGATGSIRLFFAMFLLISLVFAGVYQLGFFRDAGISYDVNQPHIDYGLYAGRTREPVTVRESVRDTVVYERLEDGVPVRETVVRETSEALHYQPVSFWYTWRNTLLTALMQEPADFFATASTHNAAMDPDRAPGAAAGRDASLDRQKADAFQYVLIFQILISWIFFGVFISLLYSKFRHEL